MQSALRSNLPESGHELIEQPPGLLASFRPRRETVLLLIAFVAAVGLGRALSAGPASANQTRSDSVGMLPSLPREIGVQPILTLVGRETIVRIGLKGQTRVYSVFDRAGAPLATGLGHGEFARAFPRLRLEEMRDVANGLAADPSLLADTPNSDAER